MPDLNVINSERFVRPWYSIFIVLLDEDASEDRLFKSSDSVCSCSAPVPGVPVVGVSWVSFFLSLLVFGVPLTKLLLLQPARINMIEIKYSFLTNIVTPTSDDTHSWEFYGKLLYIYPIGESEYSFKDNL